MLDLIRQGHLSLGNLEILVLDEADRMLDMGFLPDIKRVLAMIPDRRQTLFFSATMPPAIAQLAGSILDRPVKVQITPSAVPVERIAQRVMFATQSEKRALLGQVLGGVDVDRVLVFTRTKHGADRVVRQLAQGGVSAEGIHGNKSQNARQRALANFRSGATRVLVATDIASRGIDVEGVTHVINYDLPNEPECYVHRIGRTARAGADGVAISFCSAEERSCLRAIERLIKRSVPVQGPNAPKDGGGSKNTARAPGAVRAVQARLGPRPNHAQAPAGRLMPPAPPRGKAQYPAFKGKAGYFMASARSYKLVSLDKVGKPRQSEPGATGWAHNPWPRRSPGPRWP